MMPKISAVKKPIATPAQERSRVHGEIQVEKHRVLHDGLDHQTGTDTGQRADHAAEESEQTGLHPKERVEVGLPVARRS